MNSGIRATVHDGARRQGWRSAFAAVLCLFLGVPVCFAAHGGGAQRGQEPHPAPAPRQAQRATPAKPSPDVYRQPAPQPNPAPRNIPQLGAIPNYRSGPVRPGQEHLPEWLAHHQNMTPAEQENLLRREPGFSRLSPDQQQRVLDRLRSLDARPPAVRQRMVARNEAFERLSPEGKQDVRAAAQALRQMPLGRQAMMRHAFNDLRQLSPDQRQAILNSARFTHDYTPQERHVLSSLLSIEPYQPRAY